MDKKIRRLALVLLLTVLLSTLPVNVYGQTEHHASGMQTAVNPLYPWAAKQGALRTQVWPKVAANSPSQYSADWDSALAALQEQLAEHADTAYFLYKDRGVLAAKIDRMGQEEAYAFVLEQFYRALEHSGAPKGGDYLRWHYSSVQYGYSWYGYTNGDFYYTFQYTPQYLTTRAQEQEGDAAVEALLDELNVYDATDYEKVHAVYSWICSNVTYDNEGLEQDDVLCHSAYAALVERSAVCQGYATLMYRLLLELGVDNRLISSATHGWNIVNLGDLYYNCDATWDASRQQWSYFLGGADAFDAVTDHVRDAQYDTDDFHELYPMALDAYVPGQDGIAVTASGISLLLEDEVCGKLYFDVENRPQEAKVVQYGMTVYGEDPAEVDGAQVLHEIKRVAGQGNAEQYSVIGQGVAAKEMSRVFWMEPQVTLSDGSVHKGNAVTFSVQNYAETILEGEYTVRVKALVAAMLQYGAAAQAYFDYDTEPPADSVLTAEQAALVQAYSTDMLRVPQAPSAEKCAAFEKTEGGFAEKAISATLGGALALNCYATPDKTPDANSFMLYAWEESTAKNAAALTQDNADWAIAMKDADGDGRWMATMDGIAAKQIDDAMLISLVYTANGQTCCTGVIPYSLQTYCEDLMSKTDDADVQALAKAIAVYGYYADAYFS